MANYFNTLSLSQKLDQLSKCRFMQTSEFKEGVEALKNKKIVKRIIYKKDLTYKFESSDKICLNSKNVTKNLLNYLKN